MEKDAQSGGSGVVGQLERWAGRRTREDKSGRECGDKENEGVTKRDKAGQSGDGLEEQGVGGWDVSRNRVKQR